MNVGSMKYIVVTLALVAFGCEHMRSTEEKIAELREGMSQEEIVSLLGKPDIIKVLDPYLTGSLISQGQHLLI